MGFNSGFKGLTLLFGRRVCYFWLLSVLLRIFFYLEVFNLDRSFQEVVW